MWLVGGIVGWGNGPKRALFSPWSVNVHFAARVLTTHEESNSRLKSGNASCHSIPNRLSYIILFKNLKIKIYSTRIFPVLCGCEIWSLTLRAERRLRVFENRVLSKIFGPERDEVTGEWRSLHNEELYGLYFSPNIVRVIKSRRGRWVGGCGDAVARHVCGKGEVRTEFWWGNMMERYH